MNILKEAFGVIGSILIVYCGPRIAPGIAHTVVDFYRDLRTRRITQLSFWPELEKLIKDYGDNGEFPFEGAPTIDLAKASPEDRSRLSKFKNPLKDLEWKIEVLIALNNLSDKLKVIRDNNCLHICPIE